MSEGLDYLKEKRRRRRSWKKDRRKDESRKDRRSKKSVRNFGSSGRGGSDWK